MTDAIYQAQWTLDIPEQVTLPAPVPFDAPVLIGDCVSPLAGETILSLIWRKLDDGNEKRPNQRSGRGNR